MNCEWVERQLSAYHDSALDADTTTQVKNHLATCIQCDAVLADYARFDKALADLPRVAPRPELRERIFTSPEFQAILRNEPMASAQKNGHVPAAVTIGVSRTHLLKAVAQVAAIVVLLAGAGVLITNIMAHSRHAGLIFAICPEIPAGPRLVYRSGGTLHSGNAKLVCDPQVQVGPVWQVSPDGQWIAYVNETTGALRIVRSDATGDHIVDSDAGTVSALSWSPDSQHLAIIKHDDADSYRLMLGQPEATAAVVYASFQASQPPQSPRWAPDSHSAAWAYVATGDATTTTHISAIAVTIPHQTATITVTGLLGFGLSTPPGAAYPTYLSYVYADNGNTSISSCGFDTTGASFTAPTSATVNSVNVAAFSGVTGKWVAAEDDGTIAAVDARTGTVTPLAHIGNVTQLTWSPSGTYVTAMSGTTLWLITPSSTKRLATNVGTVTPAWGSHDTQLGFVANNTIMTADVTTGAMTPLTTMPAGTPAGLAWSADGQLAAWSNTSITLAGTATTTTLAEAPQWSLAN